MYEGISSCKRPEFLQAVLPARGLVPELVEVKVSSFMDFKLAAANPFNQSVQVAVPDSQHWSCGCAGSAAWTSSHSECGARIVGGCGANKVDSRFSTPRAREGPVLILQLLVTGPHVHFTSSLLGPWGIEADAEAVLQQPRIVVPDLVLQICVASPEMHYSAINAALRSVQTFAASVHHESRRRMDPLLLFHNVTWLHARPGSIRGIFRCRKTVASFITQPSPGSLPLPSCRGCPGLEHQHASRRQALARRGSEWQEDGPEPPY
mmetsp:Transcript_39444/g.71067  ORF Transcript_39444/g.71067 Transcript_39444/m.71067 type:complete len:264 (-) Transcript_39444:100-891(-)